VSRLPQAPWVHLSAPVAACPPERIGALPSALERSTSLLSVKTALPLTYGNSALAAGRRDQERFAGTDPSPQTSSATQVRHQGHIEAGGVDKDVTFADADPDLNDQIDAAYRDKYRRYGDRIIGGVVNPEARAATIKLVPR
jgi:hypothetical protein